MDQGREGRRRWEEERERIVRRGNVNSSLRALPGLLQRFPDRRLLENGLLKFFNPASEIGVEQWDADKVGER